MIGFDLKLKPVPADARGELPLPIAVTSAVVYVEEIPSGVHTITAVATSITALIGRDSVRPVDQPLTAFSYVDSALR